MPPKGKEQEAINITVGDESVSLLVNGLIVNIKKAEAKEDRVNQERPDDIVDWEPTPTGDRPVTRREKENKKWDLYCRSTQ